MKALLAVLVSLSFAGVVQAASGIKGDGTYGTAGCGLGSLVFGNEKGPVQIVAATLNGTGVQTFGITTGTSNCGEGVFAKAPHPPRSAFSLR
ncbi:MAG: DUF3015 family protein, partial [Bdellovibrio sp.]